MKKLEFICPTCAKDLDTRNQHIYFCQHCATYVNACTGEARNANGQFVTNVITDMLEEQKARA